MSFSYDYPRPALTADVVVFRYFNGVLSTLLIQRKLEPFKDLWAYPGGFVEEGETALQAAKRELQEETGIDCNNLHSLFMDSELDRDPRGWTVSEVFYCFVDCGVDVIAGDDAKAFKWFSIDQVSALSFDHNLLYEKSILKLREQIRFKVFGKELLPDKFSIEELKRLYNQVLQDGEDTDKYIDRLIKFEVIEKQNKLFVFNPLSIDHIEVKGFI